MGLRTRPKNKKKNNEEKGGKEPAGPLYVMTLGSDVVRNLGELCRSYLRLKKGTQKNAGVGPNSSRK